MLKVLIADDDPYIRLILNKTINDIPYARVIGEAGNGVQLVELARELAPDVIFIDVNMPGINGVEASKQIFDIGLNIFLVFATGYDNYAHDAFRVYAFDYILKPFKIERIKQTMERIKKTKTKMDVGHQLDNRLDSPDDTGFRIPISFNGKVVFVNIQDIILATHSNHKTTIITKDEAIETTEPLRKLYGRLDEEKFFRCHKGYIINKALVTEIVPCGSKTYRVKLANTDQTALMTVKKAREFKEMVQK